MQPWQHTTEIASVFEAQWVEV